jgi:periplasmic protein TonB
MRQLYRRIAAVLFMATGVVGVFAMLYYMNELTSPPAKEPPKKAADFGASPPPPPKKPPPPKQKPKPRQVAQVSRAAPPPSVTTALSGLSFDLPQFAASDALGADKLLSGADSGKKLVMTEDSVDSLPRPVTRRSPEYPERARARGIEGHVTLKIKVSERGDVEQVRVVESSPIGVFEDVAVVAVQQWRFEPATYQGTPVAVAVSQRIPFRLN